MLGYCTHLQDYQHIADVLVSCSKREGLPLNIVEAMLSGTPVVASVNRGHKELIRDGKTGFLVSVNDAQRMSERVLEVLMNDEVAMKLRNNAIEYAQNYCFSLVEQELEKVYDD
jgi:glycosyltransferase EpsD